MPEAPYTICAKASCGRKTRSRFCDRHHGADERGRGTKQERGYGLPHEAWRAQVLAADPICRWPLGYGPSKRYPGRKCLVSATVADHVIPRALALDLALDPVNGQGLCLGHHNTKGQLEQDGRFFNTRSGRELSIEFVRGHSVEQLATELRKGQR